MRREKNLLLKEKQINNRTLDMFLKILFVANLVFWGYIIIKYRYPEMDFLKVNVLFAAEDRFMDLFNNFGYSLHLNPYEFPWGNVPPLFFAISFVIAKVLFKITGNENFYEVRYTLPGILVFLLILTVTILVLYICLRRILGKKVSANRLYFYLITLITSYPFIFCMDRGNYVLQVAVLIAAFMVLFDEEKYYVAAIVLGLAAALKVYPAILGIVFLTRKKWMPAFVCAVTGISTTILPLFLFQGGFSQNLLKFLEKTSSYASVGNMNTVQNLSYNNSIYMLFDIPYTLQTGKFVEPEMLAQKNEPMKIIAMILLIAVVLLCFFLKENRDKFLLVCGMMLLYPFNSTDYNLTIMLFPIVFWIAQEKKCGYFMPIVGALLLSCKHYIPIYNQGGSYSVTIQSFLNPILLLLIIGYVVFRRRKELTGVFSKWFRKRKVQTA